MEIISKTTSQLFHSIRYNIPLSQEECREIVNFPKIEKTHFFENSKKYSVLEYALYRGNLTLLDYILDNPDEDLLLQENQSNENIIFSLIKARNIDYFKYFLELSLKYKKITMNSQKENILHKICKEHWVHGYDILKNINPELFKNYLKKEDEHGNNLAHISIMGKDISQNLLWYLKSDGIDINSLNKYRQNLLFHLQVSDKVFDLSSLVVQKNTWADKIAKIIEDFEVRLNQQDINGDYPILIALLNNDIKLANAFLENNANPFLENKEKQSAAKIIFTKYKNNKKILKEYPNFKRIVNKYNFKNQILN